LKKSAAVGLALGASSWVCCAEQRKAFPLKTKKPAKALALYFSQTGHTERIGRVIAKAWEKAGLEAEARDIREIDPSALARYDLIAAGSPVFYYEVPAIMRRWLSTAPRLDGTPVASFVTFGGKGGNQHNTACSLLELLGDRGAVPMGMGLFSNMSTFAPTWSAVSEKRILEFRHLPNEGTYAKARALAGDVLKRIETASPFEIDRELSLSNLFRGTTSILLTKRLIGRHSIDAALCTRCGRCLAKCPASAIDIEESRVDRGRCVACMGCINNCPAQAVDMTFTGSEVYGFDAFRKKHGIVIEEPAELSEART